MHSVSDISLWTPSMHTKQIVVVQLPTEMLFSFLSSHYIEEAVK